MGEVIQAPSGGLFFNCDAVRPRCVSKAISVVLPVRVVLNRSCYYVRLPQATATAEITGGGPQGSSSQVRRQIDRDKRCSSTPGHSKIQGGALNFCLTMWLSNRLCFQHVNGTVSRLMKESGWSSKISLER